MADNTILIVDDEEIVHESIIDALEDEEDYEIISAYNGEEGLKFMKEHNPILVILDLRMPAMNGIEFLEKLEVKPDDPFSIIVLTGHGASEEMEQTYDLGIRSFLRKPFSIHELRSLVESCINLKSVERKLTSEVTQRKDAEEQMKEYRTQLNKMMDSLKG